MRELILTSAATLSWQDSAEPFCTPTGALVRPIAVSTCDFDHHLVAGNAGLSLPLPIGHECVAEVVSVGSEVSLFSKGDRVLVSFQINCGQCRQCQLGRTSSCDNVPWLSCFGLGDMAGRWGGAMSDLLAVPYADAMMVPLPEELAPEQATCLTCNMPDAYRCVVPQLQRNPGAPVIIFAGKFDNIALYCVALASILGSDQIDVFGIHPGAREVVESLGGRVLLSPNEITSNYYPIGVDASMDPKRLSLAVDAAAVTGELTLSTMYMSKETPLPLMKMFEKCLTLKTGQPHVRALLDSVLPLMVDNKQLFDLILDDVIPWDQAHLAFSAGTGKQVVLRNLAT